MSLYREVFIFGIVCDLQAVALPLHRHVSSVYFFMFNQRQKGYYDVQIKFAVFIQLGKFRFREILYIIIAFLNSIWYNS